MPDRSKALITTLLYYARSDDGSPEHHGDPEKTASIQLPDGRSTVGDAVVYGIPDPDWGEQVKAVLEPAAGRA
jgi:acyl-CoA synthetase (AMP-forming)/AMP-acid ligase II